MNRRRHGHPRPISIGVLTLALLFSPHGQATPPSARPATLQEQPWRIAHIPLGMPAEDALNGQYLQGIYDEELLPFLKGSYSRREAPVYTIRSKLAVPPALSQSGIATRWLEMWFSSAATGRRAFWIATVEPQPRDTTEDAVVSQLEQRFGTPARRLRKTAHLSRQVLLVYIAPDTEPARRRVIEATLKDTPDKGATDFFDAAQADFQIKARLLGTAFRGALVSFRSDPHQKVNALMVELVDMQLAASVLALTP